MSLLTSLCALALINGCSDLLTPDDGMGGDPTDPAAGVIEVTTSTTGPGTDPDGYLITLDGVTNQPIGTNANVVFTGLGEGQHSVEISNLANDCRVTSGNPLQVSVTANATTPVAFQVECAGSGSMREVVIPAIGEWVDRGIVVPLGASGEWDRRIDGSFTPSTVIRKGNEIWLYYVGADGNRSFDGGPRHRALGLATSSDGVNFIKHPSNPLVEHRLGIASCQECGVFSAGSIVDAGGSVLIYFGGMVENRQGSVSSDGDLTEAADGVNFGAQTMVLNHSAGGVAGSGDELFPVGAIQQSGSFYVYYINNLWNLYLARGTAKDNVGGDTRLVLDLGTAVRGGGDPIRLSDTNICIPISTTWDIQMRTTTVTALQDLGTVAAVYNRSAIHPGLKEFTIYLDRVLDTWFMYYVTTSNDGIHLKTAAVTYR